MCFVIRVNKYYTLNDIVIAHPPKITYVRDYQSQLRACKVSPMRTSADVRVISICDFLYLGAHLPIIQHNRSIPVLLTGFSPETGCVVS